MDEHSAALYDALVAAVPPWIERAIRAVAVAAGQDPNAVPTAEASRVAGQRAQADVSAELRALLETDIDDQTTTPLTIVRAAARHATAVLEEIGVAPVQRDEAKRRLFPDDLYDLSPASFGEIDPALTEIGLVWGAAKAHAHLQRHRAG